MMNFLKDWIVQYQNKFSVGGVETTIDRVTGTVTQEGDTIMASYLNEIQKNCIYQVNATRLVEGTVEFYDVSIEGSDIFDVFDTQFIINFNETNTKLNPVLRFNGNNYYIRMIESFIDADVEIGTLQKTYIGFLDSANNKLKLMNYERKLTFDTVADMQTATWLVEGDTIELLGYYSKNDGAGHTRVKNTVGSTYEWDILSENGEYNILWFGAKVDGVNDDTDIIQEALDRYKNVIMPIGASVITKPLYFNTNYKLRGVSSSLSFIKKTTNINGAGSNVSRGDTVTDSYAKNAIIILKHTDNGYNYDSFIEKINLYSVDYIAEYGIYSPRTTHLTLKDVRIYQCKIGYFTYDSWFNNFEKVEVNSNSMEANAIPNISATSYGWTGSKGFVWANDGTNNITGTTLVMNNCWARDCNIGYDFYALDYSAMNSCGADNITSTPYKFELSVVTLNGCGSEKVQLKDSTAVIKNIASNIVLNTFKAFDIHGFAGASMLELRDDARTILNACKFLNFATVSGAYNLSITESSKLINNLSFLPTNGNSFVSYSNGSYKTEIGKTLFYESVEGVKLYNGDPTGNQNIFKQNKSVLSAGTDIFRITSSPSTGALYRGKSKLEITWKDDAYPSSLGYAELLILTYNDGAVYNQILSVLNSNNVGNGITTLPTFSITRVSNDWNIKMTPAHGDLTITNIKAYNENLGGTTFFTL